MKKRLAAFGILSGLALLVVTVVVVFAFGRTDASPPSLEKNPNPDIPGELLLVDSDWCFIQADASGASRVKRACMPEFFTAPQIYWEADDSATILRYDSRDSVLWEVDLNTGVQRDTGRIVTVDAGKPGPDGVAGGNFAPDGTYAITDQDGGLFLIEEGVRTKIASFDVPEFNQPHVLLWSPDSRWIVLQYYPRHAHSPELWIVSRDGKTMGTIATGATSGVAWRIPGLTAQPPLP
jgi:outer membrane protein assembly factor BamB